MSSNKLVYFGDSKKGVVKGKNEDAYCIYTNPSGTVAFFAICDGLGGHAAGDVASSKAIEWFYEEISSVEENIDADWLEKVIKKINIRLANLASQGIDMLGMGTTLVSVFLYGNRAILNSVGDSRIYFFNGKLSQISEDDSYIWNLYKNGSLTKDEMICHSKKNIVTQALGIAAQIDVHTYECELQDNELFLLCSDGLSDFVNDSTIEDILKREMNPEKAISLLIEEAEKSASYDDISIILIKKIPE